AAVRPPTLAANSLFLSKHLVVTRTATPGLDRPLSLGARGSSRQLTRSTKDRSRPEQMLRGRSASLRIAGSLAAALVRMPLPARRTIPLAPVAFPGESPRSEHSSAWRPAPFGCRSPAFADSLHKPPHRRARLRSTAVR